MMLLLYGRTYLRLIEYLTDTIHTTHAYCKGHGISAIIMGMVAFFLKGRLSSYTTNFLPKFSLYTEVLIGVSLIVIGLLGLKEAASFEGEGVHIHSSGDSVALSQSKVKEGFSFHYV